MDWVYGQRQERVLPRIPASASILVEDLGFQTPPDWDRRVPEQRLIICPPPEKKDDKLPRYSASFPLLRENAGAQLLRVHHLMRLFSVKAPVFQSGLLQQTALNVGV